jgi:hypothetical protein
MNSKLHLQGPAGDVKAPVRLFPYTGPWEYLAAATSLSLTIASIWKQETHPSPSALIRNEWDSQTESEEGMDVAGRVEGSSNHRGTEVSVEYTTVQLASR